MANYVSQVIGDEGCDEKRPGNGVLVLMWNRDDISISLVDKKALINGEEVGGRKDVRENSMRKMRAATGLMSHCLGVSLPIKSTLCAPLSTLLSFPFLLLFPFQSFLQAHSLLPASESFILRPYSPFPTPITQSKESSFHWPFPTADGEGNATPPTQFRVLPIRGNAGSLTV